MPLLDRAVLGRYDKVELLVFGETIPLVGTFPALREWFPRTGTFTRKLPTDPSTDSMVA